MKKIRLSFALMLFVFVLANNNSSYAFAVTGNNDPFPSLKYFKCKEFVKLSFKEFTNLTGEKRTVSSWINFKILKSQMRQDLKTDPELTLSSYSATSKNKSRNSTILITLLALLAVLLLIGLVITQNRVG